MGRIKTKISILSLTTLLTAAGLVLAGPSTANASLLPVPYTSQAPFGEWNDPRQQDGCEEASIAMAMMWAEGRAWSAEEVRQQIIGMSDFQKYFHGYFEDSSASDTAKLMGEYFGYPAGKIGVVYNISVNDIRATLDAGLLVLVPINPRAISTSLYNSATTRHTVAVVGYDDATGEIIMHDPIVRAHMRVPAATFQAALADYKSGRHLLSPVRPTAMITVSKP